VLTLRNIGSLPFTFGFPPQGSTLTQAGFTIGVGSPGQSTGAYPVSVLLDTNPPPEAMVPEPSSLMLAATASTILLIGRLWRTRCRSTAGMKMIAQPLKSRRLSGLALN
jgi:PEP-CTERM motif